MKAIEFITATLNIGIVVVAVLVAAVGYVSVQFALNDGNHAPVQASWPLIIMALLQPVLAAVIFVLPSAILMRRNRMSIALCVSVAPYMLGTGFWFWQPLVRGVFG